MVAPIRPTKAKAYGRDKWAFVPTIAAVGAPTLLEVNGASSLDITCMLFDSTARPSQSTNLVTSPKRVCDTTVYQQVGDTTYAGGEIRYSLDPQAAAASDGKKAFEKFPAGTQGFLVRRLGIAYSTDFATGQFVDVYPVEFGPAMPTTEGDAESAEVAVLQTFAITGPPSFVKALA